MAASWKSSVESRPQKRGGETKVYLCVCVCVLYLREFLSATTYLCLCENGRRNPSRQMPLKALHTLGLLCELKQNQSNLIRANSVIIAIPMAHIRRIMQLHVK